MAKALVRSVDRLTMSVHLVRESPKPESAP